MVLLSVPNPEGEVVHLTLVSVAFTTAVRVTPCPGFRFVAVPDTTIDGEGGPGVPAGVPLKVLHAVMHHKLARQNAMSNARAILSTDRIPAITYNVSTQL